MLGKRSDGIVAHEDLAVDGVDTLEALPKEKLIELLQIYAKNLIAMDGVWFQSVETREGMDEAMFHDVEAWKRFTVSEGCRIKSFLELPEKSGLEGLARALAYKFTSISNITECFYEGDALMFRVLDCRVQNARNRKGMVLHPCKAAGFAEYAGFAQTIDERIRCECLSCFPEVTDETCNCAWRFFLEETYE